MKNKLFFAKFLATDRLFVYEQKLIAPVLGVSFGCLISCFTLEEFTMAKKPKKTKGT